MESTSSVIVERELTKLEICFTVLRNITAERGEKTIYIRINQPNGEVMSLSPENVFTFEENEIAYSAKKNIAYTGENTDFLRICKNPLCSADFANGCLLFAKNQSSSAISP